MRTLILTASRSKGIADGLTYESGEFSVREGAGVRIPLRKKIVEGIVLDVIMESVKEKYDVKNIEGLLGPEPLVSQAQMKTLRWIAEHYCCSVREALALFLPPPPWRMLLPQEITGYRLAGSARELPRGAKQQMILEELRGKDWLEESVLREATGAGIATLRTLARQGFIHEEKRRQEDPLMADLSTLPSPRLNHGEETVANEIRKIPGATLLLGSDRRAIYASLIVDALKTNGQAILLAPDQLAVAEMKEFLSHVLPPESISVFPGRLSAGRRRREEWRRIHAGAACLVIGTRAAIYAPCRKLKLVIVDDEQEWTYKEEQAPCTHARDVAEVLCRNAGAKLILGTATPSLELWGKVRAGTIHKIQIPKNKNQIDGARSVRIIDLADIPSGENYPFSAPLLAAMRDRLDRKEQSLLLLNRRGSASALLCLDCRRRVVSPETQLPFTVHRDTGGRPYLLDHLTNLQMPLPAMCPSCRSVRLKEVGTGTQGVETILERLLPHARVLRLDRETIQTPAAITDALRAVEQNDVDILLGTHVVLRALQFPNITLAAALVGDVALSLPHFRAGERIWQLLSRLAHEGPAEREIILQAFRPDAPEIVAAARGDVESYLDAELKLRTSLGYPPVSQMIRLLLRNDPRGTFAANLRKHLQTRAAASHNDARIHATSTIIRQKKTWQVLIRGSNVHALIADLDRAGMTIDVDPLELV